jgi:hypothetical protein
VTVITVVLGMVLYVHPIKPDLIIKLDDISISQMLISARFMGFPTKGLPEFLTNAKGRIKQVRGEVRLDSFIIFINGAELREDPPIPNHMQPIRWVRLWYNRKTGGLYVKGEILGGLVELEGIYK